MFAPFGVIKYVKQIQRPVRASRNSSCIINHWVNLVNELASLLTLCLNRAVGLSTHPEAANTPAWTHLCCQGKANPAPPPIMRLAVLPFIVIAVHMSVLVEGTMRPQEPQESSSSSSEASAGFYQQTSRSTTKGIHTLFLGKSFQNKFIYFIIALLQRFVVHVHRKCVTVLNKPEVFHVSNSWNTMDTSFSTWQCLNPFSCSYFTSENRQKQLCVNIWFEKKTIPLHGFKRTFI